MGQFDMGGFSKDKEDEDADTTESDDTQTQNGSGGFGGFDGFSGGDNMPHMGDFDPDNMPEGFSFGDGEMPDMSNFDPENLPENMPGGFGGGGMPGMGGSGFSQSDSQKDRPSSFAGMPEQTVSRTTGKNVLIFGLCLFGMVAALLIVKFCVRRK